MKSDHYPVTTHLKKKPKPPPLDGGGKEPAGRRGEAPLLFGRDFPTFSHGGKENGDLLRAGNAPNFFLRERLVFGFREMQKIGGSN